MDKLDDLRKQINEVDKKIIGLLSERNRLSIEAVKAKSIRKAPIRDEQREAELLDNVIQLGSDSGLDTAFVKNIFIEIIYNSVEVQKKFIRDIQ